MNPFARFVILRILSSAAIFSSSCSDDLPESQQDVASDEPLFEADASTEVKDQPSPNASGSPASTEGAPASGSGGSPVPGGQPVDATGSLTSASDSDAPTPPAISPDPALGTDPAPLPQVSEELILDRKSIGAAPSLDSSIFESSQAPEVTEPPARPAEAVPVAPSAGSVGGTPQSVGGTLAPPQATVQPPRVPSGPPKPYRPKGNLHALALRSKSPTIVSGFRPNNSIDMRGKEGTSLKIPENALEFEDGTPCRSPVELRVWEFYDFADILLAGLSTESDEGLLETGGMVYLEAESRGRRLRLRKGSNVKIAFSPQRKVDSEFDLYHGGMRNGRIHWTKAPEPEAPAASASLMVSTNSKFSPRRTGRIMKDHVVPFGFLKYLEKDDLPEDAAIVTDFSKTQTFDGWGEISFSNGVSLFYVGQLELARFQARGPVDYDRFSSGAPEQKPSELEIRFSGSFLSGKIPSLHKNSMLRVFVQNRGFPVPYVTCSPDKEAGIFTLYEKSLFRSVSPTVARANGGAAFRPEIRCVEGKTSIYSAGKYIHLDAAKHFFSSKLTSGQIGSLSTFDKAQNRNAFSNFLLKEFRDELRLDSQEAARSQAGDAQIAASLTKLTDRLKVLAGRGVVSTPQSLRREIQRIVAPVMERLDDLRYFREAGGRFEAFCEERGLVEMKDQFSDLLAEIDGKIAKCQATIDFDIDDQTIQEILVEARKLNAFTSEFFSTQLGWHNLDRLRHARGPDAPYELVSEYVEPTSISSTQANSPSMGPFYYSVWPSFNISKGAVPGENRIPGGDFTALGFAVDGKGNIHADLKAAKTNRQVILELKQMDRETFRKRVKGFQ